MGQSILIVLIISFSLGSLPLIAWVMYGLTGKQLSQIGTKNVSVSAAFYHGGTTVGVLAVLLELFRGIAVVLLARSLIPEDAAWEILALIPLVLGRYWFHKGAGVTNVVWGYIVHDWRIAFFVALIGGIGFTVIRERKTSRWVILMLVPFITMLVRPYATAEIGASILLCLLLALIYRQIPDDLDASGEDVKPESRKVFSFFRGDRAFPTLDQALQEENVGAKAATLSQLRRWGYPVPMGWVVLPGDDSEGLVQSLNVSSERPVIVRSTAIGEDDATASAAGQYESIPNITNPCALRQAIIQCQQSYMSRAAITYRRDRDLPDTAMAVLVQRQIQGVFSGVAFSRDPITRQGDAVVIEALPGNASQVVSGHQTPEQYRVFVPTDGVEFSTNPDQTAQWRIPDDQTFPAEMTGEEEEGQIPSRLIQYVAYLVRHLEDRYHGIPQDMEWTYDGHNLWVLQSRPITTLLPIWTRKIASEVIPGFIRPLTWSINCPLTCGVWGEIFTLVLGDRAAQAFDFQQTATLHHSVAYFNASLLGHIFRRMGLPEESLEFLTRGAKFKRPSLMTTLRQVPGLGRLVRREWRLVEDFQRDRHHHFDPGMARLTTQSLEQLSESDLWKRSQDILHLLQRATYYSILGPLSAALRQAILKVNAEHLDYAQAPEVSSLRDIRNLADQIRPCLPDEPLDNASEALFSSSTAPLDEAWNQLTTHLSQHPEGSRLLAQWDQLIETYGYLSDVATDIAVPTWRDNPRPVRGLLLQSLQHPSSEPSKSASSASHSWTQRQVQRRVDLKGQVSRVYSQLLAELRWTFLELERRWLEGSTTDALLMDEEDIFFLKVEEIQRLVDQNSVSPPRSSPASSPATVTPLSREERFFHHELIRKRRSQWQQDQESTAPPYLVYGNEPVRQMALATPSTPYHQAYSGIGASPGQVTGPILTLATLQTQSTVAPGTIIVVPYTDAGWAPLLTQASGIIAEVGGCLSHGAIIAREYGIPAVMNVPNIMQGLQSGQVVYLDGTAGTVKVLEDDDQP